MFFNSTSSAASQTTVYSFMLCRTGQNVLITVTLSSSLIWKRTHSVAFN